MLWGQVWDKDHNLLGLPIWVALFGLWIALHFVSIPFSSKKDLTLWFLSVNFFFFSFFFDGVSMNFLVRKYIALWIVLWFLSVQRIRERKRELFKKMFGAFRKTLLCLHALTAMKWQLPLLFGFGFRIWFEWHRAVWFMCLKTENYCLKIFVKIHVGEKVRWNAWNAV